MRNLNKLKHKYVLFKSNATGPHLSCDHDYVRFPAKYETIHEKEWMPGMICILFLPKARARSLSLLETPIHYNLMSLSFRCSK